MTQAAKVVLLTLLLFVSTGIAGCTGDDGGNGTEGGGGDDGIYARGTPQDVAPAAPPAPTPANGPH